METSELSPSADSIRGQRAIGAMFFAIFGGVWIGIWSFFAIPGSIISLAAVALGTIGVFAFAFRRYRRYRSALEARGDSPSRRRADRLFNIVNAGQWVVIVVGANVLANIRMAEWIIPFAMLVIGLHFLPLARIFANPPHYLTGGALILLSIAYPLLLPDGPGDPAGCLGAGLILWASALSAATANPRAQR